MDVAYNTSKCALLCDDPMLQHRTGMWRWRFCWWKAFIAALLLCNILVKVPWAFNKGPKLTLSCLYPLGGGLVPPGGAFYQPQLQNRDCLATLQQYLVTQYDDDFYAGISTAWDYFDSYPLYENATQIVVFDIDETSLSNEKPRMGEALHRSMALLRPGQQLSGVVTSYAPALQPLLELYTELWERGFSVTFITGRTDVNGSRNATAANLEAVGYGRQCSKEQLWSSRERRSEKKEPCYVQLDMREEGDGRLASVYKPDRRRQLQERGFIIVGSFGDQFSDLDGTSPAQASFKLPNPWYYIM